MDILLTCIRAFAAIIIPIVTIILVVMTSNRAKQYQGFPPEEGVKCLRCEKLITGGYGSFHYTEKIEHPRPSLAVKHIMPPENPALGSESHFVCDDCARRYIRIENIQALVLAFVAAPIIIRSLFRLRVAEDEVDATTITTSWSGS